MKYPLLSLSAYPSLAHHLRLSESSTAAFHFDIQLKCVCVCVFAWVFKANGKHGTDSKLTFAYFGRMSKVCSNHHMENQLSAIFALLPCVCVCVCVCIACRCRRHGEKIEATANLLISADTQKVRSHPANHGSHSAVQVPLEFTTSSPFYSKWAPKKYELACDAARPIPRPQLGTYLQSVGFRRHWLLVWRELLQV